MKIETLEEGEKISSPVIGIYDIKLRVSDGIRFGFGLGLGLFLWILVFSAIFSGLFYLALKAMISEINLFKFI